MVQHSRYQASRGNCYETGQSRKTTCCSGHCCWLKRRPPCFIGTRGMTRAVGSPERRRELALRQLTKPDTGSILEYSLASRLAVTPLLTTPLYFLLVSRATSNFLQTDRAKQDTLSSNVRTGTVHARIYYVVSLRIQFSQRPAFCNRQGNEWACTLPPIQEAAPYGKKQSIRFGSVQST